MFPALLLTIAFSGDYAPETLENLPEIPEQIASWHINPAIKICDTAIVTSQQVKDSYSVFGMEVFPEIISDCDCSVISSEIRFVSPECGKVWAPEEDRGYGFTSVTYLEYPPMLVGVSISIIVPDDQVVLTHEVGHSLGWMHSSDTNHLMFPFYDRMTNSLTLGMTKDEN